MSLHEDISRQHDVKRGTSRSVGVVFAAVFGIVAILPLVDGEDIRVWSAGIALAFLAVSLLRPKLLDPLNRIWFRLGLALHTVVSPLVLGLMFFGVVSPIGLIMKISGKDPLNLAIRDGDESYWIVRTPPGPSPESMRHQF